MKHQEVPRRGRGRPPRVTRESIIQAARGLDPGEFSMQAVADRLGVDRSTLNYHFADRQDLLALVAAVTLGAELKSWRPPASDDWRVWAEDYARRVHGALTGNAAIAVFVRMPLGGDVASLAPVEGLISKLTEAGFGDDQAAHAIAYISEVVHATAQNEILHARGGHPQAAELSRYLAAQPDDMAPGLRRLATSDVYGSSEHFEFALRALIAGLEAQLRSDR